MADMKQLEKTYTFITKRMRDTGQAPFYTEIASELGVTVEEGRKALHELLAKGIPGWLFPNTDTISSFSPFRNLPTQYRIGVEDQQRWFGQ